MSNENNLVDIVVVYADKTKKFSTRKDLLNHLKDHPNYDALIISDIKSDDNKTNF